MSENSEFELLAEIAKLLRKYGPETFEKLADNMSSPEFAQSLVNVLSTTARVSRTTQHSKPQSGKAKRTPKDFRLSLVELERTKPTESALLLKLYDDLMSRAVLPTLREIQSFASDVGLPTLKATGRDKAIIPLIKILLTLPLHDLEAKLSVIKQVTSEDDRSLEGWSNIILGNGRPRR